jgi:FdhE protein
MPRTSSHIGLAGRLPGTASYEITDPGWQPWIDLFDISLGEAGDPAWTAIVPTLAERSDDAPLLDGATVRVDARRAGDLTRTLAQAAGIVAAGTIDAAEMIRAAIAHDDDVFSSVAGQLGVAPDTIAVLAQLTALPLLHSCARLLGKDASRAWQRGYCPVCGVWPSLSELRGIDRDRRLRCGCCGADWSFPVLRCAFCDEVDHRQLGSLVVEGAEQHVRVETCASCRGYLKTVTTLGALPFRTVALKDLATVPLDLAARDRGYARPPRPAWLPRITLVA